MNARLPPLLYLKITLGSDCLSYKGINIFHYFWLVRHYTMWEMPAFWRQDSLSNSDVFLTEFSFTASFCAGLGLHFRLTFLMTKILCLYSCKKYFISEYSFSKELFIFIKHLQDEKMLRIYKIPFNVFISFTIWLYSQRYWD